MGDLDLSAMCRVEHRAVSKRTVVRRFMREDRYAIQNDISPILNELCRQLRGQGGQLVVIEEDTGIILDEWDVL